MLAHWNPEHRVRDRHGWHPRNVDRLRAIESGIAMAGIRGMLIDYALDADAGTLSAPIATFGPNSN
jgi:hypothetical protein